MSRPHGRAPIGRRLIWFLALWVAGVAAVAATAAVIRLLLPH